MTAALARVIGAGLAAVALFVLPSAHAQSPAPAATLDADARAAVVEAAAEALRERYVFPDVGDQAAAP